MPSALSSTNNSLGDDLLRSTLEAVAPGTELRDALERILAGRTGALIVLGFDPAVEALCSGGFELDVPFSATRLRELAKMDGAVILSSQAGKIVRAAVQLLPDPSIPTSESGTRHRTAERVAKQTGFPVISVSQSMNVAALYVNGLRHVLLDPEELSSRAKQALDTLESYRDKLDEVEASLAALEVEDLVSVRDVAAVAGRQEMVWRIGQEVAAVLAELGTEGRLLRLQFDELIAGVEAGRLLLVRDYAAGQDPAGDPAAALDRLATVGATALIEAEAVAGALGLLGDGADADTGVSPRGFRLLSRVPGLGRVQAERIVEHFGNLQAILGAPLEELMQVEGLRRDRARAIREGLSRIAETVTLERFV
ncbi:MAG: DNA integrity scanning diadenylate cyclase DisA [Bifidobacteriaceae bacterium]|jgi:diadenylate cyclase|nr:DNA integrity scanning diadenylate cyclase DisA [Bifidobacteriaceae bacterium]